MCEFVCQHTAPRSLGGDVQLSFGAAPSLLHLAVVAADEPSITGFTLLRAESPVSLH